MRKRQEFLREVAPNLTQQGITDANKAAVVAAGAGIGSLVAPELLPADAGLLARAAATGAGAGVGTAAGQTATGKNPLAAKELEETAINTLLAGGSDLAMGTISAALTSKLSRGLVNYSAGATPKDVFYGNPAKALLDEGIVAPNTGDLEKLKSAFRAGANPAQANIEATGRIAAVQQKINELSPQLYNGLVASKARISASTVTDPIDKGVKDILANRGITKADATAAIDELNSIKEAALKVPSLPGAKATAWSPLEANAVKQEVGGQINWMGKERVGQLVEPIRREIYQSLKDAVNTAAPGTAEVNERLTNLHAAQSSLSNLMRQEEAGQGRGLTGSAFSGIQRRVFDLPGRITPAVNVTAKSLRSVVPAGFVALGSMAGTNPNISVLGTPPSQP